MPKRPQSFGITGLSVSRGGPVSPTAQEPKRRRIMTTAKDEVITTREACEYLKISRPTFLKLVHSNQIKAKKVGKGWKLLKSELQAYLRGSD